MTRRPIGPVRARALSLAFCATALLAGAEPAAEKLEKIEVTGSRIAAPEVESPSPIAVITAADIKAEGYQSLELILNNFPQLVAHQGGRVSSGATGTSSASLRGLFPERTLVLVNGKRMPAGSPYLLAADLNQVPVHLISRIEILTGGASAVYGSDAIAGVINIILNDRFEGVQGEVAHDFFQHRQKNALVTGLLRDRGFDVPGDKGHDGVTTSANLTLGGNFGGDKGNATVSFRYVKSDALLESARDYSACSLGRTPPGQGERRPVCGGSSASYPGLFLDLESGNAYTVADAAGGVRAFRATDLYNFGPSNYYQRPVERRGVNAFAHYDFSTAQRLYGEVGYHDDHTVAQIAPSGLFGDLFSVRYENPLLSAAWRSRLTFLDAQGAPSSGPGTVASVVIARRNVEGGGRQDDITHTSVRTVVGLKGETPWAWDYDVFLQAAKVTLGEQYLNDFSFSRLRRALDVVADPASGAAACASTLGGTDRACVPYNVWRLDGVTPAALDYLNAQARQRGFTSQQLVSATTTGDLGRYGLRFPRASRAVEVALGIERRVDRMEFDPDAAFASGDLAGQGANTPPVHGRVAVNEIFGEARLPIVDALTVTSSYRYSEYSTDKKTDTFGVGFNAAPARALRVRGSLQRAVRAANIAELFTPEIQSEYDLEPGGDPCAGRTPARSLSECMRTGVTAAQYGHIDDVPLGLPRPAVYGGNPRLSPETANTLTLGSAFNPARDLTFTVDYYDIRINDFITFGTPEVTLERCLDSGDPVVCALITRDPVQGTLWLRPARILATNQNIGRVRVSGVDIAVDYSHGISSGHRLSLAAIGSYMNKFTLEKFRGADAVRCDGTTDCGEPRPRWRHRLRGAWRMPWGVEASATWRYLHSLARTDVIPRLPPMNYLDLAAAWQLDKRVTLRAGVNNVTDRDPPLITFAGGGVQNGNTFAQTYDALGRHVFVSLSAKF